MELIENWEVKNGEVYAICSDTRCWKLVTGDGHTLQEYPTTDCFVVCSFDLEEHGYYWEHWSECVYFVRAFDTLEGAREYVASGAKRAPVGPDA